MKTIGDFYKEKILTQKKLVNRNLPGESKKGRIEKDLFNWKLYSGNDFIECESEEEARYLKVFMDIGLSEVKIPKDEKYLKEILHELESMKHKVDNIRDHYLQSLMGKRLQKQSKPKALAGKK